MRVPRRATRLAALFLVPLAVGCGATVVAGGDQAMPVSDGAVAPDQEDWALFDMAAPDLLHGPACGAAYCLVGEVCEVGVCHRDCGTTARCGSPEVCCAADEVCHLGACTKPGRSCVAMAGTCASAACPDGQYCEAALGRCLALAPTTKCEFKPPVGQFAPKVKWEWQGSKTAPEFNQVMMAPMVGDLDGDCLPDVVFATFTGGAYSSAGVLRAVRGDGKAELWTVTDAALRVIPGAQVALADVDGDGKMEVFACHESRALAAFNFDGTKRWISSTKPCGVFDAPLVADLDHDGKPEVAVSFAVLDAATGKALNQPPTVASAGDYGHYVTAAELDGDVGNGMELVAGGVVYHRDGKLYWDKAGGNPGYPAVADLDGDGKPDVVSVASGVNQVRAFRFDGTPLWGPVDVNNGVATPKGPSGGGPPTIADFDGDGRPDVATAGGYGYLVLEGATGKVLWQNTETTDTSSRRTGSSVFDFEGDGPAEAVYNDEQFLRVYRGKDGMVLFKVCSTSGTLWENPVIVDVDADDHAEIVVMSNNYAFPTCKDGSPAHTGFKVIGDEQNRWVRTRRIWNQHTYHVTNVDDDGKVPKTEADNWKQAGLNNFRQNVQTHDLHAAPDLVPRDLGARYERCAQGEIVLVATVFNQGAAGAPAGLPVTFFLVEAAGSRALGTVKTTLPILPGASQGVSLTWTPPAGTAQGPHKITVAVDDDGMMQGVVNECDEANNLSAPTAVGCPSVG